MLNRKDDGRHPSLIPEIRTVVYGSLSRIYLFQLLTRLKEFSSICNLLMFINHEWQISLNVFSALFERTMSFVLFFNSCILHWFLYFNSKILFLIWLLAYLGVCCLIHTYFIYLLLATPCNLWDLRSPTRDWTWALSSESTES